MNLAKYCLRAVALAFSISLFGCGDKEDSNALKAAQKQATANSQKSLLKSNAVKLAEVVENYGACLEGIGNNADKSLLGLNQILETPDFRKLKENAPRQADDILGRAASRHYDNFQKLIRNLLEVLDDKGTDQKLATVRASVMEMPDGKDKDTFTKGIESCEKAQEWLTKYRQRRRSEVTDQIQQMKECAEKLRPTILELEAVQDALEQWIK